MTLMQNGTVQSQPVRNTSTPFMGVSTFHQQDIFGLQIRMDQAHLSVENCSGEMKQMHVPLCLDPTLCQQCGFVKFVNPGRWRQCGLGRPLSVSAKTLVNIGEQQVNEGFLDEHKWTQKKLVDTENFWWKHAHEHRKILVNTTKIDQWKAVGGPLLSPPNTNNPLDITCRCRRKEDNTQNTLPSMLLDSCACSFTLNIHMLEIWWWSFWKNTTFILLVKKKLAGPAIISDFFLVNTIHRKNILGEHTNQMSGLGSKTPKRHIFLFKNAKKSKTQKISLLMYPPVITCIHPQNCVHKKFCVHQNFCCVLRKK